MQIANQQRTEPTPTTEVDNNVVQVPLSNHSSVASVGNQTPPVVPQVAIRPDPRLSLPQSEDNIDGSESLLAQLLGSQMSDLQRLSSSNAPLGSDSGLVCD